MSGNNVAHHEFILAILFPVINLTILAPVIVYYSHSFYKQRNNVWISRRYPRHVATFTFLIFLYVVVLRPIELLLYGFGVNPRQIIASISAVLVFGAVFVYVTRVWLLYFHYKYNDQIWKTKFHGYENWFTKSFLTWGNERYVGWRAAFLWFLDAALIVCLWVFTDRLALYAIASTFVIFVVVVLVLVCRIQNHDDVLAVRLELTVVGTIGIVGTLYYSVTSVVFQQRMEFEIGTFPVTWFLFLAAVASIGWIDFRAAQFEFRLDHGEDLDEAVGLRECLHNTRGFQYFFRFLISQHCSETLLCISEIVSFIQTFHPDELKVSASESENESKLLHEVLQFMSIPEDLPQSLIMKEKQWSVRAIMIMMGYIDDDAVTQVNLPHKLLGDFAALREKIDATHHHDAVDEYLEETTELFCLAAKDLHNLLRGSFHDFRRTPEYQVFLKLTQSERSDSLGSDLKVKLKQ